MRTWRDRVPGRWLVGVSTLLGLLAVGAPAGAAEGRDVGGPLEKGPYLGVSAVPVDEALGCQLGLPTGVGLKVEFVDPESPAHGVLQRHDVLHKLDDQILVSQLQLAVLVRMRRPGDTINLAILRASKAQTAAVKLAEKELPPLRAYQAERQQMPFGPPQFPMMPGMGPGEQGMAPAGSDMARGEPGMGPGADWPEDMLRSVEEALRKSPMADDEVKRLLEGLRQRLPKAGGNMVPGMEGMMPVPPAPPAQGALGPNRQPKAGGGMAPGMPGAPPPVY